MAPNEPSDHMYAVRVLTRNNLVWTFYAKDKPNAYRLSAILHATDRYIRVEVWSPIAQGEKLLELWKLLEVRERMR